MHTLILFLSLSVYDCFSTHFSVKNEESSFLEKKTVVKSDQISHKLKYKINIPDQINDKTRLVILIHGVGSNEENMMQVASLLEEDYLIVSARGPMTFSENAFGWYNIDFSTGVPVYNYEEASVSIQKLTELISSLQKEYKISQLNTVLIGFSQGAVMSYSVALEQPSLIGKVIGISGRILKETKKKLNSVHFKNKPKFLIIHGESDKVLPLTYAQETLKTLTDTNLEANLITHPHGHSIPSTYKMQIRTFIEDK